MKTHSFNYLKMVLADRLLAVSLLLLIALCLAYCIYVGVSLRPSDLQVAVHYTGFGETTFYRDKWYYFINFIAFGLLVAVMHTILTIKIYAQGRRHIALLFTVLSIIIMVIAWILTRAVLKIAFL